MVINTKRIELIIVKCKTKTLKPSTHSGRHEKAGSIVALFTASFISAPILAWNRRSIANTAISRYSRVRNSSIQGDAYSEKVGNNYTTVAMRSGAHIRSAHYLTRRSYFQFYTNSMTHPSPRVLTREGLPRGKLELTKLPTDFCHNVTQMYLFYLICNPDSMH